MSEVARLATLWRLTLGAAHTLNNALAAMLGEAGFLLADRKDDPEIVESCEAIRHEVERCARLTRALLARRVLAPRGPRETDLVRLVRDLVPLLRETLSRRFELHVESGEEPARVAAPSCELETLMLVLIHQCCDRCPQGGSLGVRVERRAGEVVFGTAIAPAPIPAGGVWQSPEPRLDVDAARSLASGYGARLSVEEGDEGIHLTATFPTL